LQVKENGFSTFKYVCHGIYRLDFFSKFGHCR
jgi:hypothetical protein